MVRQANRVVLIPVFERLVTSATVLAALPQLCSRVAGPCTPMDSYHIVLRSCASRRFKRSVSRDSSLASCTSSGMGLGFPGSILRRPRHRTCWWSAQLGRGLPRVLNISHVSAHTHGLQRMARLRSSSMTISMSSTSSSGCAATIPPTSESGNADSSFASAAGRRWNSVSSSSSGLQPVPRTSIQER